MIGSIWSLDEATNRHTNSPTLAALLCQNFPTGESIIDLGCGRGYYIDYLSKKGGFKCFGVEGTPGINSIGYCKGILEADLSKPLELELPKSNILSLEVGEHIFPEFEEVFLDNVVKYALSRIIMSWAITLPGNEPNKQGHGHFNEQPNEYVIQKMEERGFDFNKSISECIRKSYDVGEAWWFENTIMVFDRSK